MHVFFGFFFLLKSYKSLESGDVFRWTDVICPGCLSLFASETTKGKIMPLREGKLGHEKGDLFSCLARENLESGDHFISTQRLEDVRVLVLKFLGDCVKLLFRKWLFFRTLETSPPPKGLWIGSVITVSISPGPVWGKYIAACLQTKLGMTTTSASLSFLRTLRKMQSSKKKNPYKEKMIDLRLRTDRS